MDDKAVSTITFVAPVAIPFNFVSNSVVKSLVDKPLPDTLSTLLLKAVLMTLFCTGFSEDASNAVSITVLFAPVAIPFNFVSNADVKSFVERPLPDTLSTLLLKAVLMTLFCTGFSEDASNAVSITVLFAPVAIPSSLASKSSVKSLVDNDLPLTTSTFPAKALYTALF